MVQKYWFNTGKKVNKVKQSRWRYKNSKKTSERLSRETVEGKKIYFLIGRIGVRESPRSFNINNFKKELVIIEEEKGWNDDYKIINQKPKKFIKIKSKIITTKHFRSEPEIKLEKDTHIWFFNLDKSKIIRELQLKDNDKIVVEIKKC